MGDLTRQFDPFTNDPDNKDRSLLQPDGNDT
jgi:hypothetical protein